MRTGEHRCRARTLLRGLAGWFFSLSWLAAAPERFLVVPNPSSVTFEVRHLASTVTGSFSRFAGEIVVDGAQPESGRVRFTIDVASLVTDDARRTLRLAQDDFFATARFPTMEFVGQSWTHAGAHLEIAGHLTIKGVTRPVVVDVKPPEGAGTRWEVAAKLDRRDFGVTGGPPGLIGNEVEVRISLETRRSESPPSGVAMVTPDEPGERLRLRGTVYAADGTTPVPGAKLYIFHTDAAGKYSPAESGVGDERNPRLSCRCTTDEAGRYEVQTILPGRYPGGKTPRHVHMIVSTNDGRGQNATFSFSGDPSLSSQDYERHARQGTFSAIRPATREPDGTWSCRRDIRLTHRR